MSQAEVISHGTADISRDADLGAHAGAYFPKRYLTDFFRFVEDRKAEISVITYDDLPWNDDWDFALGYPGEWKAWNAQLASGERDPNKAYLLLQYDVDSRPERTMELLREPTQLLVPANVMIFNKRVDRRRLKTTGELAYTDYELDEPLLRLLCDRGFVVGYHTNAYEQSLFNTQRALELFDRDVRELSARFPLEFFTAHGGVPGPDGRNNRDLPFHPDWWTRLRWVHNGHSPRFDGQFSDGGHNSLARDPAGRDLRDFVRGFMPGKRYRVLLHPQYYLQVPRLSARFNGTPWYDEMMRAHREAPNESLWKDVELRCSSRLMRLRRRFHSLKWL